MKKIKFPLVRTEPDIEQKILYLIKTKKYNTMTGLSKALSRCNSTMSEHLKKLTNKHEIKFRMVGKKKVYEIYARKRK